MNYTFQFDQVLAAWPQLLQGTWVTIQLSFLAMIIGLAVAIVCAWGKTWPGAAALCHQCLYRADPQHALFGAVVFFFFALPAVGLRWSPQTAALVAMVVNLGAYATEIIRAGIESIPKGQIEAGLALDLKRWEIFRFVILKPALKTIYPALTSQFILLMLSSAVVSVISADDLTSVAANIQSETFRSFEVYIVVAVIYLLLSLAFNLLFKLIYQMALNYPDRR